MDAPFAALRGHRYMRLTTFRRNGTPVSTPVWFAEADDGTLFVMTPHNTGKLKRVRHNPNAEVAPCTPRGRALGSTTAGVVDVVDDPHLAHRAGAALSKKYRWMKRGAELLLRLRRGQWIYLRVRPTGASPSERG